jgi:hypothetical protein
MSLQLRSLHLLPNSDSSIDTRYPQGTKAGVHPSTLGLNTAAFNAASINLTNIPQGAAITYNFRQYLTGTSASTATLSVNAINGLLGGWAIDPTGNGITNNTSVAGSGTLQVIANDGAGTIVSFPLEPWSVIARGSTQLKKWHPGHWGGFNTVIFGGSNGIPAAVKSEINAVGQFASVLGYLACLSWSALEPIPGESDISATYPNGYATGAALVRSLYDYAATSFSSPKNIIIKVTIGAFSLTHPGSSDSSVIPQYIQNSSTYGAAGYRVAGAVTNLPSQHGFWGGDGNGNTYAACIHRPAVMARIIKMTQIIGAYFDNLPFFYGWSFDENSFILGASSNNACPDYGLGAADTGFRNYCSQCAPVFKNSHFIFENSYQGTVQVTQVFMDFQMQNGVVQSNTDVLGYTYSASRTLAPYTWGMQAYCGFLLTGATGPATNYRDQGYPCMPEVQATDMGAYGQFGGGYAKEDILKELNVILKASHAFWSVLVGQTTSYGNIQPNSTWVAMGPFLNNPVNALVNTAYPSIAKGY